MEKIKVNTRYENQYTITLRDATTKKIKQEIHTHNTPTEYARSAIRKWACSYIRYVTAGYLTEEVTPSTSNINSIGYVPLSRSSCSYTMEHKKDDDYLTGILKITFLEGDCNGDINVIGLGESSSSNYWFISKFKDAEGNDITITKTATDILELVIEIHAYIDTTNVPEGVLIDYSFNNSSSCYDNRDLDWNQDRGPVQIRESPNYPYSSRSWSYLFGMSARSSGTIKIHPHNAGFAGACYISTNCTNSSENYVHRLKLASPINSTQGNYDGTVLIKSISVADPKLRYKIPLPNHDIYPPTELEFELTGDGVTTEFNIDLPELMQDRIPTITINGSQISPEEFTWNGRNYNFIQAWESCKEENLGCIRCDSGPTAIPGTPALFGGSINNIKYIYDNDVRWDFKTPKTLSILRRAASASSLPLTLYGSNDAGETWDTVATLPANQLSVGITNDTPYRYFKLNSYDTASSYSATKISSYGIYPLFGNPTPMIVFKNPPPAEAIIKIKAYTEYPLKNNKWIIQDFSIDFSYDIDLGGTDV